MLNYGAKGFPRFDNNTRYTTTEFTIYKRETLHFAKGTGRNRNFRFVNIKSETNKASLENNSIIAKKMKNYGICSLIGKSTGTKKWILITRILR